jgi:hypothetical protein
MCRRTAYIYDLLYQAIGKDYAVESEQIHQEIQRRHPGARSLLRMRHRWSPASPARVL